MIEDELRTLLRSRVAAPPDDPDRVAAVRSRIARTRRRRAAGGALALVLLALASLVVVRLPGTDESLPPGVPAPPWFTPEGDPQVPGYETDRVSGRELTGQVDDFVFAGPGVFRGLVVVQCERAGSLTVRNAAGTSVVVDCDRRTGDHFEGARALSAAERAALLTERESYAAGPNVRFEPGSEGRWKVGILTAKDPDRLSTIEDPAFRPLAEGRDTTVPITIPGVRGEEKFDALDLSVECVAGVRIAFSVPAGPLGTAVCDPLPRSQMTEGRVTIYVTRAELDRLGLRTGQRVPLTIRSVGRVTDQWRVYPIG